MTEKFSQLATNIPLDNDPNKQYLVINGYPVVLSFAKEANTETFERIRDILLATSYTKKASWKVWTKHTLYAILEMEAVFGSTRELLPNVLW